MRLLPVEAPLRIDGKLDDAVWQRAPVFDAFVQYLPQDKRPVPSGYRTTVQVVVDEQGISFGIRAFDPRPEQIRAPLARRDQVRRDQDFVSVVLDPVGTRRSAQFVRVNAAGVVADGMFIADTDNEDFAPDFEVDAAVARLPDGYSVEIRLPLLALRYPYSGGKPWRLMVTRSIPREVSTLLVSAPLTKDALNFIAELQEIDGLAETGRSVTDNVRDRSFLSVRPELTARTRSRRDANGTGSGNGRGSERESKLSLSADIKWRPRADWVFDATLNPDFSQVELDVPQLAGNTRFALSVPEKRAFFLESTDVLDLPLAAFYSRAVTDPRWGLRATWRGNQADATALSLQDAGGGLILQPGPYGTEVVAQTGRSQASLARGRVHGDSYTVGGVLSRRDYSIGRSNQVAGADVLWRASEQEQFRLRGLLSDNRALFDTQGAPTNGAAQTGQHVFASWWKRTPDWNLTAEASHVSPRFRNDNGFVEQAGVRSLQAEVVRRFGETQLPGFTAYEFETFVWTQQRLALADSDNPSIQGGEVVTRRIHTGLWLVAARNTEAWVQMRIDAERAGSGLKLHPVPTVASGYSVNPAPWFPRLNAELEVGQRLDVEADRVGRGAVWMAEIQLRGGMPNPLSTSKEMSKNIGWEITQRINQGFINGSSVNPNSLNAKRRALTDTAVQWLGMLHFNANNSLRVVWQGTHYRRSGDTLASLVDADSRSRTTSAVFQHRFGLGRSLSLGASQQTSQASRTGQQRSAEAFAKLSYELDR